MEYLRLLTDPVTATYIRKHTRKDGLTIDVGCGPAQYRNVVLGGYLGVDLDRDEFNSALYPGLFKDPDVLAEARSLPFRPGSFTTAVYSGVLYLLSTEKVYEAMTIAYQLLKSGGMLIIMDHSRKTDQQLQQQYEKVASPQNANPRSCRDWLELLSNIGFKRCDLSFKPWGRIKQGLLFLKRILPRPFYFAWIDNRQAYIIITAQKQIN